MNTYVGYSFAYDERGPCGGDIVNFVSPSVSEAFKNKFYGSSYRWWVKEGQAQL